MLDLGNLKLSLDTCPFTGNLIHFSE